jgi:hypothetical protein
MLVCRINPNPSHRHRNKNRTSAQLLCIFKKWNNYNILITYLKLKRSYHSPYWLQKKFIGFLKNPDLLQNLRDSDENRCGSGSDTGVENGLEKKHFILNLRRFFLV